VQNDTLRAPEAATAAIKIAIQIGGDARGPLPGC
jgi:hypothetical protein